MRTSLRDQGSYVMCIVGGRHEFFPGTDAVLRSRSPEELPVLVGLVIARTDVCS